MNLQHEKQLVDELAAKLELASSSVTIEKEELEKAQAKLMLSQNAQEILQHLAKAVQQRAHQRISEVVSSCLSAVFDDPYEFKIEFETKRGRTDAVLRFCRRGLEVDPLTACGGGMVDVAAFALRAACLILHRPRLRRLLVLDEPFRFVSAEFQPNVRRMLEGLSKDLEMQIVMVTHNETYETGRVIRL